MHDYCTTCTNTDIDRYRHTHTYTHTIHTHNTHTQHTHTPHASHNTRSGELSSCGSTSVQQEVAKYVAIEVRRATRSGELHCSRSTSCNKKQQPPLQQKCVVPQEAANYVHADPRSREVEAASKATAPHM
jgi:hypothetical protein